MAASDLDPWLRANLYQPDEFTRSLLPERETEHYDGLMARLGQTAWDLNEAMATHAAARTAVELFFEPYINTKAPEGAVCASGNDLVATSPDYNTEAPEGAVRGLIGISSTTPDYTPVTDLNEYRQRHGR